MLHGWAETAALPSRLPDTVQPGLHPRFGGIRGATGLVKHRVLGPVVADTRMKHEAKAGGRDATSQ